MSLPRVGDTGTPGLATGDDDLYVEGDLEVDGSIYDASGNVVGGYWVLNTGKLYPTTLTNLVGIGTVSPISRLSVVNNPGAGNYTGTAAFLVDQYENQDILTASASGTTKMTLTSDGTLKLYNAASTISNTSGDITLDSASNIIGFSGDTATNIGILQVAGATAATYSRFGSDTTGHGGAISAGSDLLVSGDLELNGNLYLDSGTIANAAGTAAILLSSSVTDTANTLSSSNWFIENTANVGQAALMVNQTKSGDLLTASQSGVTKFTVGQETSTSDLAKLTSNIITTGNVLSATASAITSGNMIKLGEAGPQNFTGNGILMDFDQTGGGNFTGNFLNLKNNDVSQFIIDSAGKLYDQFVTAGIRIGDTTSAALSGFGASSIVGALNELKNSNKTITHNDYWSWAQHYQSKAEGTANDGTNTPLDGLFFDTFLDSTKADTVTSTSSGIIQVSDPFAPVKPAAPYRVGLMGGATMNSSQTDNDGQTYLSSNVVYDIDYYDRTKDSTPAVLIELGIDPNWYNGVTLSVATTSATLSQSDTVPDVNPNLNTTYNGSLIKATGTYPSNANAKPIYITIKTPTTFDWTNYNGHAATAVTITPGTAQALGSSGVSITFSNVLYNVGDVFRIASWYVEPEGANRGAKQQFPERANIIANSGGVDIIDVDTQKLWISFAQSTNYMIGVSTNNDPNAVKMLNSKLYIAENGSAATGLYAIDFGNDAAKRTNATNTSLSDRPIAQRNFTTTYNGLNTGQVLINVTAQDVDAAVIPNDTTKEITVSGWGFVAGTTNPLTENVYLPYTFNSPPIIESVTIGYISGANPVSLSDCTSNAYNSNTSIYAVTNSSFTYSMRDSAGTPVAATRYCYSWTATGKVSPKQVVAVATGVSGTDGGVTVINETSGDPSRHYFVGSQDATVLWSDKVAFADDGTLYITHNAGTTLSAVCTYYGILGVPSETIWAQYYNGCYYVNSATGNWSNPGLVIKGASVNSDIKSLQVTSGTSTVSPGSNTLYIGTSGGVSVIQENQGRGTWVDSAVEGSGSIKYYTYQYISEEMVGDIRNMMPFAGTGALSADTTVPSPDTDVTIRTNTFTTKGSTTVPTRTAGVRGKALSFDGGDYLVTGTTGTAADDADFDITTGTTISLGAWIYPTSTAANQMIQSKWSNGPFFLRLNNGTTIDFTIYNGGVVTITSTMPFSLNQWHHVVAVRNGANMYIYINGNLAGFGSGAGTAALSDSAAPFCIGCWSPNTTTFDQFFNGVIDEPFVTATALSELKVKQMYEVGYRAMQSHANPGLGISAADSNQQFSGTTNLVGAAIPDYNNQYLYVGTNSTSVGSLSKMQLNSDTLIKQYNGSNNTPAGGTLVLEEDITSLGVGYQLEAVGSATSGVKSMSPDNNAATYGATSARSFLSKTQTLSSATKLAYVWASRYKDSSESTSRMVVYACNEYATAALCTSNNAWVVGTSIQTDSSQSIPE
ncbi:MAG: PDK domain-containing protein, nonfunctional, partial [Candidatus Pacebacteria bacterium GW2011_GWA1_46_10]